MFTVLKQIILNEVQLGLAKVIIPPTGARPQESDPVNSASPTSTYPEAILKASSLAVLAESCNKLPQKQWTITAFMTFCPSSADLFFSGKQKATCSMCF